MGIGDPGRGTARASAASESRQDMSCKPSRYSDDSIEAKKRGDGGSDGGSGDAGRGTYAGFEACASVDATSGPSPGYSRGTLMRWLSLERMASREFCGACVSVYWEDTRRAGLTWNRSEECAMPHSMSMDW